MTDLLDNELVRKYFGVGTNIDAYPFGKSEMAVKVLQAMQGPIVESPEQGNNWRPRAHELMTDSEINEAVARKLGWIPESDKTSGYWVWRHSDGHFVNNLPDYCHSIEAAWEIVEKICGLVRSNGDYRTVALCTNKANTLCVIDEIEDDRIEDKADSAPMAICQAFLKLP